jgi:hypothetical protein
MAGEGGLAWRGAVLAAGLLRLPAAATAAAAAAAEGLLGRAAAAAGRAWEEHVMLL